VTEDKTTHAEALFAEGRVEEARGLFLGLLETDPSSTEVLNNLGVISHAQGKTQEAEQYFARALALKHDDLDAALNLATVYQESRRWTGAAACLERCQGRMSSDFNFLNQLGRVYLELGHADKALGVLSKSLRLNPDQEEVRDSVAALQPTAPTAQNASDCETLRILFVQEAPCIRNYKMARALMSKGHKISLAYTKATLSQMYKGLSDSIYDECIKIHSNRTLWELSASYDIVHCHNEPDVLTVAALAGDTPVVHDTHDLISLRANGDQNLSYLEGIANRGAAGRIYSTPYQRQEAERLYGCKGPSMVFYNYVSEPDLPAEHLPKLSDRNGQTHIVYEGGVGGNAHRDFKALFFELASQGIHIHIYPNFYDQALARLFSQHEAIHYYEPLAPKDLMGVMTQYDYGIIPFNLEKGNKGFLDSTIANKLFEYVAAGLPVVASSLRSYEEYFARHPVGMTFRTANDILEGLPRLNRLRQETNTSFQVRTYEGEIHKLVDFYQEVIRSEKGIPPQKEGLQKSGSATPVPETTQAEAPSDLSKLQEKVAAAVLDLDQWLGNYGWAGFDPYDIKSYLLRERVGGKISVRQAEEILMRERRNPGALRRELGVAPRVNAKAMGLFLSSYLELTSMWPAERFEDKINACLQWLLENRASGMQGYGWGYPFDWESVIIIPEGTPTAVISYHVGDAFWRLYRIEKDPQWLELCLQIADFLVHDLNRDDIDARRICFSYTPLDFYHIHNANLSVAEFLVRIGKETGLSKLTNLGEKALDFTLSDFASEGYLTYWARGYEPSEANVGQIDHYHTAAELRALFRLSKLLPKRPEIKERFEHYFEYYLAHFFHQNTIPKIHPKNLYPINIHAAAEAAYILGETAVAYPEAMETATRFLPWFLDTFQNPDGSFAYQIERHQYTERKNRFPFLRWGQAWSMRGLVSSLIGLKEAQHQGA
jgi:tetratricopeptide (TPR) repeat protein